MYAYVHFVPSCSHKAQTSVGSADVWNTCQEGGKKTLIYSFVSGFSNTNKLKGKIRIEQGRGKRKKKTCVGLAAPQGRRDLWFVHVLWILNTGRNSGCQSTWRQTHNTQAHMQWYTQCTHTCLGETHVLYQQGKERESVVSIQLIMYHACETINVYFN